MIRPSALIAGLCAVAIGGAALAQGDPSGGSPNMGSQNGAMGSQNGGADSSMSNGMAPTAPSSMSKSDMKTMKMCQGMAPDAMAKNSKCKAFMSAHPDMFNPDGTMKSGMTPG